MAVRATSARRIQLSESLIPFRHTYLLGGPREDHFDAIVNRLEELAEGSDSVAMRARINLADFYRFDGDTVRSLVVLEPALAAGLPPKINYAANMMCAAIRLQRNQQIEIEQALTCYGRAALNARNRDDLTSAYEGIQMSIEAMVIADTLPDSELLFRVIPVYETEEAEKHWDPGADNDLNVSQETEQPTDYAHSLDTLAGGAYVGRQREMEELEASLEDALSGRGRLVTLVGEPGVGKTRTAHELATYAGLRNAQVLWGCCYEDERIPLYRPWVQAIRSYVRKREPEQLRSEMGAGAADIAALVSDVKERLPDLPEPTRLESPEEAGFRLFDSITVFLKNASQKQPLVLVLEDLHWADQPSLLLLQFIARELTGERVLLVGTYRDMEMSRQHPLAKTIGVLTRARLVQRVLLSGLSQADVGRFIEVVTGIEPPQGLTDAVFTQTEGNPLYVTEVVRALVREKELAPAGDRDSWRITIPLSLREVIVSRLKRLSQRCNETLIIASVIGREFSLDQLKPLVDDATAERLLETLEEALLARVIEKIPQAVGRYKFTHALIQATLTDELSRTLRVRLHARIAEALEKLYGTNASDHAAELAYHFSEAESVLGTEKLIKISLLAGERALMAHAREEALDHFQRGLFVK